METETLKNFINLWYNIIKIKLIFKQDRLFLTILIYFMFKRDLKKSKNGSNLKVIK